MKNDLSSKIYLSDKGSFIIRSFKLENPFYKGQTQKENLQMQDVELKNKKGLLTIFKEKGKDYLKTPIKIAQVGT